ncbi:MAG: hypothetical protein L0K86_01555 [Actinomycetia bacterium]|nr:hypothetical protein [Actinomycetes bacterium]
MIATTVGVAAAATTTPAASAAPEEVPLSKEFAYKCHVVVGNLDIGLHRVDVRAEVSVPVSVAPGTTIPGRKTQITLTLSETLRSATAGLIKGQAASGYSDDSTMTLTVDGKSRQVPIANLSAPRTPIPQEEGALWRIPTEGDVPAIEVPADAKGVIGMAMPEKFSVVATVHRTKKDGGNLPATMDCKGPRKRDLGTIALRQDIDKTYPYNCQVVAGSSEDPIDLGDHQVGVRTGLSLPLAVQAGHNMPSRDVGVTLAMPEELRAATRDQIGGVTAGGSSDDTKIGLTIGSDTRTVAVENLSAPQETIPETAGEPWLVAAKGQLSEISVPKRASGDATMTMPDAFTVQAEVVDADDQTVPVSMDCALPDGADAALASVHVIEAPAPRTKTRTSASAPKVAYGRMAKVRVKVTPKARGKVRVFKRKRRLGTARLGKNGRATVRIGYKKLRPGRHTLRVRYLGNDRFRGSTGKTAVRVIRAKPRVIAKVTTKRVIARKTRAWIRVRVKAPHQHPSGKVVVRVGKKRIGKARVWRGSVEFRLHKFAKRGRKRLVIRYAGSKTAKAGKDRVRIWVRRRR